ncbi:Serine kinase of the HPr protein, regulates carbohydrate metabolism [Elusimicrobium minutum Pei191]|uniref:HPr kinase/phosphorylase n=1 Tax=Elusimicrobium minutum (strain Pei191) TaxID=445932 RepID=B2KAZ4_ELUMP|nr:HPr(Ser) kinase/phosphatase [Elusimicrobium minutum]ACC97690.1 Serine kinase of the HPr protein, regulates carbohydrate metabolism [Elusimicrobium minutum Pei191]
MAESPKNSRNYFRSISVEEVLKAKEDDLRLETVCCAEYLDREISHRNVNRPGLALVGYLENFRADLVQVIGRGEYAFCKQANPAELKENVRRMLAVGNVPCLVITAGQPPLEPLIAACKEGCVPLFTTVLETSAFVGELSAFLDEKVSPTTHVHGVLVNVSGLGILIRGEPGIGKSECAVELVKRGHILVSDDIVEVQRRRGNILIGSCPNMIRHYMEVRGLGIIDVELLFGVGFTMESSQIAMEVKLTSAASNMTIDRLGIEQKTTTILDLEIPSLSIPVTPGRNLAILIEVAALNQRLRHQGIFSAQEFSKRVLDKMGQRASGNKDDK